MRGTRTLALVCVIALGVVIYTSIGSSDKSRSDLESLTAPEARNEELVSPAESAGRTDIKELNFEETETARVEDVASASSTEDEALASEATFDPEWEAYVLAQPQMADDNSKFEEKYEGFSDAAIIRAQSLVANANRADQKASIPRRIETGDFADITGEEDYGLPRSAGQKLKTYTVEQYADDEGIRTCLFEFPESDYPWIHYRARENEWLLFEKERRGIRHRR